MTNAQDFAADYREASSLVGGCWFEHVAHGITPLYVRSYHHASADDECEHGRLSGDRLDGKAPNWPHTHPCGCWPAEKVDHAPDLMTTLKTAKEAAMATLIVPDPKQYDRPIGPRRKPGRKPKAKAAPAPAPRKPAKKPALKLVPTPPVDPIAASVELISEEIARVRAAADAEIEGLTQARDTLERLSREAVAA